MRISAFTIHNLILIICIFAGTLRAGDATIDRDSMRVELIKEITEANNVAQSRYPDSALVLCVPLVEKCRSEFGDGDSTYAQAVTALGTCYYYLDDYDKCENSWSEALSVHKKTFGLADQRTINLIYNLGQVYRRQVRLEKAEEYLFRALELWGKYVGEDTKKYGTIHGEIGAIYLVNGDFYNAEKYFKRWAEISKEVVGENHRNYADALRNLAIVYERFGYPEKAERNYQEALRIFENSYGPVHPAVARCLTGLGTICLRDGRFAEAEPYFNRALEIRREFFRDNHPQVASSYWNLAELNAYQGHYAAAESLFHRSIDIYVENYGPDAVSACEQMRMLGIMLANHGRYDEGIALMKRSIEIREKIGVEIHQNLPTCYYNLALAYCYKGDFATARDYYEKLLNSRREFLDVIFAGASNERKLRYSRRYPHMEPSLYSMAMLDNSPESKNLALDMLLNGKGYVLDAVAAEKRIAYCAGDFDVMKTAEELSKTNAEIANLTLAEGNNIEDNYFAARLSRLYNVKDSLESFLSAHCSDYREDSPVKRSSVRDIADAVPASAVLIEFARYKPFDLGPEGSAAERTGKPRYLAITLNHSGNIKLVDLADASRIDSLIDRTLFEIENAPAEIYQGRERESENTLAETTSELYDLIFAPLVQSFDGKTSILISPDDRLSLMPFDIIPAPDGSYLIEKYQFSYLSSGRDLLKFGDEIDRKASSALVVADPDYDMLMVADGGRVDDKLLEISGPLTYLPLREGGCLGERFSPLPSTYSEGQSVARQLEDRAGMTVEFLHGMSASEDILKNLSEPPSIIHLSTHGYFCPQISGDGIARNPLVYSGLALAGSNRFLDNRNSEDGVEDGIMTSLEVSGLDLVGTDLVVLSACLTGAGETVDGEGVFGMRRAFQLAGARSIIMSMWSVPDLQTKMLMQNFYENWLTGESKAEALRNAALSIIRSRRESGGAAHPLFWGGFVLVGDPK